MTTTTPPRPAHRHHRQSSQAIDDFALADIARSEQRRHDTDGSSAVIDWRAALGDDDAINADAERQLRAAWLDERRRNNAPALIAKRGRCSLACTGTIQHFDVRVYATGGCVPPTPRRSVFSSPDLSTTDSTSVMRGGVGGASAPHLLLTPSVYRDADTQTPLHVCSERFCAGYEDEALSEYHWFDRTDEVRRAGYAFARSSIEGGGVYWCPVHTRMHVCTPSRCDNACKNSLGYSVCVLSGKMLQASTSVSFGQGTVVLSREMQWQRDADAETRRQALAVQRSAMSAVENVILAGNSHTLEHSPLGQRSTLKKRRHSSATPSPTTTPKKNLFNDAATHARTDSAGGVGGAGAPQDDVYIDADLPADDLFPDSVEQNTFATGIALELARFYAQTYASTYTLLFSEERARLEKRNREAVLREAKHKLASYINAQRKSGRPVLLTTCRQIEMRVLNSKRVYPELLLPRNAKARLNAYYALVCMEFYLQLINCITSLMDRFSESMRTVAERFQSATLASVAPNILDLMHEGLRINGLVIIDVESTLSIFPETDTIDELGVSKKTCTDVKKMLKKCVVAATNYNVPIQQLRTTRLDVLDVIFGSDSVVSLFLGARRERLGLGDEGG